MKRERGLVWFGLVSLFNSISTFVGYLMHKAILLDEQWYYFTHSWEDKGVHSFPKGICPKVNVIARLELELAYYDSAVRRFNHYTTRIPPHQKEREKESGEVRERERCLIWFGLVWLFNGISTFVGYLMPKPFSLKNCSGTI